MRDHNRTQFISDFPHCLSQEEVMEEALCKILRRNPPKDSSVQSFTRGYHSVLPVDSYIITLIHTS